VEVRRIAIGRARVTWIGVYYRSIDARSGDLLWKVALGGQVNSGAMTYSVNGKQYITVTAGNSLFAFALRQ